MLNKQKFSKYVIFLFLTAALFPWLTSCNSKPDTKTEQLWKENHNVVLLEGYKNFQGQYMEGDTGVDIFSYQIPTNLKTRDVFEILSSRIANYDKISETEMELVLRSPVQYSSINGFDEYHLLINSQKGTVTVMFGNFDSESEIKSYSGFVEKLYKLHQEYTKNVAG